MIPNLRAPYHTMSAEEARNLLGIYAAADWDAERRRLLKGLPPEGFDSTQAWHDHMARDRAVEALFCMLALTGAKRDPASVVTTLADAIAGEVMVAEPMRQAGLLDALNRSLSAVGLTVAVTDSGLTLFGRDAA